MTSQPARKYGRWFFMSRRGIALSVHLTPWVALLALVSFAVIRLTPASWTSVKVAAVAVAIPSIAWTAAVGACWPSRREPGIWMLAALILVFNLGFAAAAIYGCVRDALHGRHTDLLFLAAALSFLLTLSRFLATVCLMNYRLSRRLRREHPRRS